jgi:threonine 3-dehydrogenase
VIFKGLTLQGIYGRKMFETWYKTVAMLRSGLDVSSVVTHHFPVTGFNEASGVMASGQSGKVVLDWTE